MTLAENHSIAEGLRPETGLVIKWAFALAAAGDRFAAVTCGTVLGIVFSEGAVAMAFSGHKRPASLPRDKGGKAMAQHLQTKTVGITTRTRAGM